MAQDLIFDIKDISFLLGGVSSLFGAYIALKLKIQKNSLKIEQLKDDTKEHKSEYKQVCTDLTLIKEQLGEIKGVLSSIKIKK